MADQHLSLWLDREPPKPARRAFGLTGIAAPRKLQVEFLDEDDNPVGAAVDVPLPEPAQMEVPSGEAGFDWTAKTPPVSLPADAVSNRAVALRASHRGAVVARMALAAARAPRAAGPAARQSFNPAGTWKLLLVSDGFTDSASFFAAAAQLNTFILGTAPFSDPAVAAGFQIEALFWPTRAGGSLFNTKADGRLVFGDNEVVQRFVAASGSTGRLTMVLVNSPVRGGAGGTSERPAWVTITSAPTERWEAVALHELGHSFGLADEYDEASQKTPEPTPLEPNVTASPLGSNAPWAALCTPGLTHNPTSNSLGQPAVAPGTVGTFEGARYEKSGRFRPTANCLMRVTNQPFCPVCRAAIRKVLTGA